MRRTGGEVVRRRAISIFLLRRAAGEPKFWEQATDNWQTGTDQANGRLDMRPQCRLVHGVRGIGGINPEEHDDTIDTRKANENTQRKDTIQRKLVLPRALQIPNHRHWKRKNHKIDNDVEDLVHDEELVLVETFTLDARVPEGFDRAALQAAGDDDSRGPGDNEGVEGEGHVLEFGGCEDAAVEADNGGFDGGAEKEVSELVCKEDLAEVEHGCHVEVGLVFAVAADCAPWLSVSICSWLWLDR